MCARSPERRPRPFTDLSLRAGSTGSMRSLVPARWAGHPLTRPVQIAGALIAFYGLTVTSILFRPGGSEWSTWSPGTGLAVAVVALQARRDAWRMALAFGVVAGAASFTVRGEILIAAGGLAAMTAGLWVGALILRGETDRRPVLRTVADLARLLSCAVVTACVVGVVGGVFVVFARGPDAVLLASVTTALRHVAGILLIAPLIVWPRHGRGMAAPAEALLAWLALLGTIAVVFGLNGGLPLAFIVILPLTWGAARLAPRSALYMLLVTSASAAILSPLGHGPFAIGLFDARSSATVVQVFTLCIGVTFLTLILFVRHQRLLIDAVRESETLFRTAFDSALVGTAIVKKTPAGVFVEHLNAAGKIIARYRGGVVARPREVLSGDSYRTLVSVIGRYDETGDDQWRGRVTTRTGRTLDLLLSRLRSDQDGNTYNAQFLDITEQARAEDAIHADLTRAADVQRALLPRDTAPLPGYEVAGAYIPATSVGGDFYDWYPVDGGIAVSLGDVMGKGVGAGMIAATVRAVLRSAHREPEVGTAVGRAADAFDTQIAEADSFSTLFHARITATDGSVQFVDAGHGLALMLRTDGTASILESVDLPLGVVPGSSWTARRETLHPGDTLIVVSDGVLELHDGGLDALLAVAELARTAASLEAFTAALSDVARRADAPDDVTVLAIRRSRSTPAVAASAA
jgi:sigma-B regulation protein RsbU (phosphoserine phosphatase)